MRNVTLYFVRNRDNLYLDPDKTIPNICCVTVSKKEVLEFVNKRLYADNAEHYLAWCALRNLEPSAETWKRYYHDVLEGYNPYMYAKVKVPVQAIACLERIFYGYQAIGCSFETILDSAASAVKLSNEEIQEFLDKLDESEKKSAKA